jgi:hypothetical protein
MGRIRVDNMAGHQPIEEHPDRGQVLLDGGWRELVLQVVHESDNVARLDLRELVKVFGSVPAGKTTGRVHIGSSRMGVVDLGREKLEEAARGFNRFRRNWARASATKQKFGRSLLRRDFGESVPRVRLLRPDLANVLEGVL